MKLTSTRLLKSLMLCAGFAAATTFGADANAKFADDFEDAVPGQSATAYKADENAWTATGGDASTIELGSSHIQSVSSPMTQGWGDDGLTDTQVLKLDTMGGTLSRALAGGDFTDTSIYVDTMVKFVKSEDTPTDFGTSFQIATWVNADLQLVIKGTPRPGSTDPFIVPGVTIDPEAWYRLTIEMRNLENMGSPYFRFALNGEWLDGFGSDMDDGWVCGMGSSIAVESIAFQGTGFIDELMATTTEPSWGGSTSAKLTLSWGANITVTVDGTEQTSGYVADSPVTATIAIADWYEITTFTMGATTTSDVNLLTDNRGTQIVTFTGTADDTVTLGAVKYQSTDAPVSFGDGKSAPADKVATWALLYNKTPAQVAAGGDSLYNAYLFNMADAPTSFVITSVELDGDTATITVKAEGTGAPTDFQTGINGTLKVYLKADLSDADWTTQTVTFDGDDTAKVTVDTTGFKFIRAIIE